MPHILVVDDEPIILNLLNKILTTKGYEVSQASDGEKALELLQNKSFDLLISDIKMAPMDGIDLLREVHTSYPDIGILVMTAHGTIDTAIAAMKQGAFDYITKPFKLDELTLTVQRVLEYHNVIIENKMLKSKLGHQGQIEGIVAESSNMRDVRDRIECVAPSDSPVFISGESGTEKDWVARALHQQSLRSSHPFMTVNCAALPEQQIESELFGNANRTGVFENANNGTLFLNGIDFIPLDIQSRLLQILQNEEIQKTGESDRTGIDLRVISASREGLAPLIEEGKFCKDLYRHLSAICIDIPPLRARPEDILPLVHYILHQKTEPDARVPKMTYEARKILDSYSWPGNVRELEKTIQHALSLATDGIITKKSLPETIVDTVEEGLRSGVIISRKDQFKGKSLKEFLHNKEKELLKKTLRNRDEEKGKDAESMGKSLSALYNKLPLKKNEK